MSFGHRGFSQLHNPKSTERMEFQLKEFKGHIEVHFVDEVPHPTTLQAKQVPFQLRN
jgi:hypothetical protein